MALKSIIYKVSVLLADMDRAYYNNFELTIARHPSETDQRLITRILAYILNADENLKFGRGLSDEKEAAIWRINYAEEIELWIELGHPDEKRLKKASHKAKQLKLYCYHTITDLWWRQNKQTLSQFKNLTVEQFNAAQIAEIALKINRNMEFQVSIQDGQCWLTLNDNTQLIEQTTLQ